ncbi:MAG: hypothetical protein ABEI74_00965 [Candidatus Pacearchaeota archaeon]
MERGDVETVREFNKLLDVLRRVRKKIVERSLEKEEIDKKLIEKLQKILVKLKSIPENGKGYILFAGGNERVVMSLDYEIESIRKDLIYLKQGEKGFKEYLRRKNENFDNEVKEIVEYLEGKTFDSFISDRDGALNEFSDRYTSSIQSTYNAVFLEKFLSKFKNKIILTSAPLKDLRYVNIFPENDTIFAGSRGRQFVYEGKKKNFYVPWKEGKKLGIVSRKIKALLREDKYRKLKYLGSGLQEKFGGITVARQNHLDSVDKRISKDFLEEIKEIVKSVDPKGEYFDIKDTGLDIQVNLKWGMKVFDKGSGLGFILNSLNKNLSHTLVCGNSESDLRMVEKAKNLSDEISVIFVTESESLKSKVRSVLPNAKFVSHPDNLVFALKQSSSKIRKSKI